MRRLKLLAMGAAAICAGGLAAGGAEAKVQKIGLMLPYSGVYAALGKEIDEGFMLALEEAGIAKDMTVSREDSEAKPPVGLAKARKLVLEDQVDVMVGVVSTRPSGHV